MKIRNQLGGYTEFVYQIISIIAGSDPGKIECGFVLQNRGNEASDPNTAGGLRAL